MIIKSNIVFETKFPSLAAQFTLKLFQKSVIDNIINHGSTLAIMPTGGGKSLIYWVAGQALGGTTLVISPLIALIDEQTEKLRALGFSVLAIHSGIGASEQIKILKEFALGKQQFDFIFASPERMATDGYFEYCIGIQKSKIKLLVIDEVHCISQWGFEFRPFYTRIPVFLNEVFKDNWPVILGLTATINPKELNEVSSDFNIKPNSILKSDTPLRFDILLRVEKLPSEEEKRERLWQIIEDHPNEKVLVYVYRKYYKGGVEDLCKEATDRNINSAYFHGEMSSIERQNVIKEYRNNNVNVVFATNAFGMGIDIPNIRVVIHFMLPESIEQYYQEIGRAGRDEGGATAYMLYSNKNINVRKSHFIDKSFPSVDEFKSLFRRASNNEIGKKTLQYFAEEELQKTLPYFLNCGAITIEGKGFTNLRVFKEVSDQELQRILDGSRTGGVIPILKKAPFNDMACKEFFNLTYSAIVENRAILSKNFDKCLIISAKETELTEQQLLSIQVETVQRKDYKHKLLDYLVYLFDNYINSKSLHQEIGRYLGVNKHLLGKIHKTNSGIWVRSLAEVIIANLLDHLNIPFEYEAKLYYDNRHWKEPDFTITHNGKTWHWEHLGMLGDEEYDKDWKEKKIIYQNMGIYGQVIITKESAVLSRIVNDKVREFILA